MTRHYGFRVHSGKLRRPRRPRARSAAKSAATSPYSKDWEWLQAVTLRQVAIACLVLGWLWWLMVLQADALRPWAAPLALVATGGASWRACVRLPYRYAAWLFTLALSATVVVVVVTHPEAPGLVLVALVAGAAGLLISPALGLAVAGFCALTLAIAALRGTVPINLAATTAGMTAAVALLARAASEPLRTVLAWSWNSYEQARIKTDALMKQRGELQRTLKDLNQAYDRMEKMSAELERARQAAVEARRLKAQFAANVSHELRTPLNLIIGFSEMMFLAPQTYGGVPLPAPYRGDVEAIFRSAKHLSQLIDDVLDLSQVEAGRMGLVKEPLMLADVAQEAANTVYHLFERKGLSLRVEQADGVPPVLADRTRIRQVLMNLLNNASRFTDQGGVVITITHDEQAEVVAVKDSGVGITPADMPKVFEEFRQLDGSTRRRQGGSGLGLAISRRFVELHGGRMWVESRGIPGEGSTFRFNLPLEEGQTIISSPASWETWARPTRPAGERTVIVIDHTGHGRRLFERFLVGYRVLTVGTPAEAEALGLDEPVHAYIVVEEGDPTGAPLSIPKLAGVADVPLIYCRIKQDERTEDNLGVAAYMVKPILRERFLAALRELGPHCRNILLADDEPEVIRMLARMIRSDSRRYVVRHAYDGLEAWQILQKYRPDAIILDLLMPKMDGYGLLQKMRGEPRLRDIPVIVITAGGSDRESMTASLVALTRPANLSVGEMMRYLQAGIDALRPPPLLHTEPEQPARPVE
jgi:signal transduction histidine kinase/CheY-like chemotaxis protein